MNSVTGLRASAFVLLAVSVLSAGTAAAQSEKVGVTAAVNTQAEGTPPSLPSRTLSIGLDMIRNERIVTGPQGKTQLLFLDGSALTIGPSAEVVLDEFVYDSASGTGKLAMTASKGVLRIVGGKLSKTDAIEVRTPTATLGIRGGIALIAPNSFTFLFGDKLTVTGTAGPNAGETVEIVRRGTMLPLGPNGQFLPLQPVTPAALSEVLGGLEGDRGRNAGSNDPPTDQKVAASGLDQLGSNLPPEVIGAQPAAGGGGPAPLPVLPDGRILTDASQTGNEPPATQTTTVNGTGLLVFGSLGGRYKSTPGSGSAAGTAGDGTAAFDRAFSTGGLSSNLFQAAPGGELFAAPVSATGGFLTYTSSEATSPFGPIAGTSFISPNRDFVFFESVEADFTDERSFLFAGVPTPATAIPSTGFAAYDIRRDFIGDSNIPFIPAALGGNLTGTVSPAFIGFGAGGGSRPFLQYSIAFSGSGETQSSAFSLLLGTLGASGPLDLTGEMRGSSSLSGNAPYFFSGPVGFSLDPNGNGVFGTASPDYFVLESRGASGRGVATSDPNDLPGTHFPNNVASRAAALAGLGEARNTTAGFSGYTTGVTATLSGGVTTLQQVIGFMFLTTSPATNTLNAVSGVYTSPLVDQYTLYFGDSSAPGGRSAFIDDQRFAARESDTPSTAEGGEGPINIEGARLYLISGNQAQVASLLPPGSYCECGFMRWGFWGGDFTNPAFGNRERIHLGQWLVGNKAIDPEIAPLTGSGVYAGHAIADVINNGKVYKAGGAFGMTYDFADRIGTATITNLDGITYTAGLTPVASLSQPSGTLSGSGAPGVVNGPIDLQFYRNGLANPAAGVGGTYSLANTGNTYQVNGIALGQLVGGSP